MAHGGLGHLQGCMNIRQRFPAGMKILDLGQESILGAGRLDGQNSLDASLCWFLGAGRVDHLPPGHNILDWLSAGMNILAISLGCFLGAGRLDHLPLAGQNILGCLSASMKLLDVSLDCVLGKLDRLPPG